VSPQQSGADDRSDPGAVGPKGSDNARDDTTPTIASGEAAAGTVIGLYHLLQLIGQGGMGEVWLAEQKEPVRRRACGLLKRKGFRWWLRDLLNGRQNSCLCRNLAVVRNRDVQLMWPRLY
jgi:hypothetical protein